MLRLYDFECQNCNHKFEKLVRINEHPDCPECGYWTKKMPPVFNVNMGPAGANGYYDDTLGKYINTNAQRKEECRKQGVTPRGETPKPTGEAWF